MVLFYTLIAIHVIFLGAVYGRVDGGGITRINEWLERSLVMFFFVLACAPFAGLWALAAYIGVVGIATGHGQYFLNGSVKAIEPEKVDIVNKLMWGEDPRTNEEFKKYRGAEWPKAPQKVKDKIHLLMLDYGASKIYWRSVTGMALTGFLVGLPAFFICMALSQPAGVLFLLTGPAKALAYILSNKYWQNTEAAEYINGGLRNVICIFVILFYFVGL